LHRCREPADPSLRWRLCREFSTLDRLVGASQSLHAGQCRVSSPPAIRDMKEPRQRKLVGLPFVACRLAGYSPRATQR
jgi:hypothetical protein